MLLLCGYKEFNVEYFIYINCRLISITATLCIVALNTIIAVWLNDWAHIRENTEVVAVVSSLPPSLPPPCYLSQFSLDSHPGKTWQGRRNILTEDSYFWMFGKVLIHFAASWHVELQFWASNECMGRKMLMCWHRYLVTILGGRVLGPTNQSVI